MAFGTPSKSSRKSRKGKSREKPEADEELLSWSEKNPGQLQGIVVLGSMIVTVCMLFNTRKRLKSGMELIFAVS